MNYSTIHISGICGIGMSAIAQYLQNKGYIVQGSDLSINNKMGMKLQNLGIKLFEGQKTENITNNIDAVVYSTAVKSSNPEIIRATELGITLLSRKEILNEITKQHENVISISGTHGKTTTTTMLGNLLFEMNINPTVMSGGIMGFNDNNFQKGDNKILVLEADESDGTFCAIKNNTAIITNIEFEHAEYYRDMEHVIDSYLEFATGKDVKNVITCGDDKGVIKMLKRINDSTERKIFTYGATDSNDIFFQNVSKNNGKVSFDIVIKNEFLIEKLGEENIKNIELNAAGTHNIYNAVAVFVAALLSVDDKNNFAQQIKNCFSNFGGIGRRFTKLPTSNNDIMIVDDYAHHPTEIKATINSGNDVKKDGRLIAVLQPHRYTRLSALMDDFANSILDADIIVITDVYSAGEQPIDGVSGKILFDEIIKLKTSEECFFAANEECIKELLKNIMKKDDVIVFMGAGTISQWAYNFAKIV